ncbi:MAG TPA: hypothetical protein VFZ80_01720 [Acidimicrobiia bacterium]
MPAYDGVVIVAEDDIPVIVELGDDVVRLSASGREIGEWRTGEYEIRHIGESTFAIQAENEILEFVPSQPTDFAAAVNGGLPRTELKPADEPSAVPPPAASEPDPGSEPDPKSEAGEAPPPTATTLGLFYALCLVTVALGIWAVISLIV